MFKRLYDAIEKIDVHRIVKDHFSTLRKTGSDEPDPWDVALFFAVPSGFTLLLMLLFGLRVGSGLSNALFTALSIFAGLLFNLLVLVYDIVNREDAEETGVRERLRATVLREVFANVSYAILVSLAIVFLIGILNLSFVGGLLGNVLDDLCHQNGWLCNLPIVKWLLDFLILSLASNFTLTLLMVLRRVHLLLSTDFRKSSSKNP